MFIRVTELKNRNVVDPVTARKRGRVVDVLVDPTAGRLAGLTVAADGEDAPQEIAAGRIARIGRSAVMLRRDTQADGPDAELRHENYLDYDTLVGLEVLDEGGDAVGGLKDARIDCDRLDISAYALAGTGWRGWLGRHSDIAPSLVTSWSRELMIVGRGMAAQSGFPMQLTGPTSAIPGPPSDSPPSDAPTATPSDGRRASRGAAARASSRSDKSAGAMADSDDGAPTDPH